MTRQKCISQQRADKTTNMPPVLWHQPVFKSKKRISGAQGIVINLEFVTAYT